MIAVDSQRRRIFWITLGLVVTHPALPPRDVKAVVFDSLDAIEKIAEGIEVFDGIHKLRLELEGRPARAMHVLYCLSTHRLWSRLRTSKQIQMSIKAVRAEEVVRDGFMPPVEWEVNVERNPAEDASSPPVPHNPALIEQAAPSTTQVPDPDPSTVVTPHPLEVSVVVDWASSMTQGSPINSGVQHLVNTDGASRSRLLVTLPISPKLPTHFPLPRNDPPSSSLIHARPHPGRHDPRDSTHVEDAPSSPVKMPSPQFDLDPSDGHWPDPTQTSPQQSTLPLHSQETLDEVDMYASFQHHQLPTPGEGVV